VSATLFSSWRGGRDAGVRKDHRVKALGGMGAPALARRPLRRALPEQPKHALQLVCDGHPHRQQDLPV